MWPLSALRERTRSYSSKKAGPIWDCKGPTYIKENIIELLEKYKFFNCICKGTES